MTEAFDIAVVGGGHAGCEAALAAARLGLRTALVTLRTDGIGELSCNPAMGGLAKGHLIRELDALGGEIGRATDACTLFRHTLNLSRGPAVQGTRAQVDRPRYRALMQATVAAQDNLTVVAARVRGLRVEDGRCAGLTLADGSEVPAAAVVLTTGTFLGAVCHRGEDTFLGGRIGETEFDDGTLSAQLRALGVRLMRLKTGTCPRLDRATIDYASLQIQHSDPNSAPFSDAAVRAPRESVNCWGLRSDDRAHQVVRDNLHRAPTYAGTLHGKGPRYCPSFEDKVARFPQRDSHQLWLEPEGVDTEQLYLGGMSTSLPAEVQRQILDVLPGMADARVLHWGYSVAYDAIDPIQLTNTLELHALPGLYLAGQINGTSGYEEAAAQGFCAAVNAACALRGEAPFVLGRNEAYIGVMIDDLTTRGVSEPYRMLTSRAEHRLELRECNAFLRLDERARALGLVAPERLARRAERAAWLTSTAADLRAKRLRGVSDWDLLSRPKSDVSALVPGCPEVAMDLTELVAEARYSGYIARERRRLGSQRDLDRTRIPSDFVFIDRPGLSNEAVERLRAVRPETLGQAARIEGMTPAAVQVLALSLGR
jgi:tRNA uridine 5-carboxymethylaminomethyl modification enzyme